MNKNIRYVIFIFILFAYAGETCAVRAQDALNSGDSGQLVSVNASVDKARATIGDKIEYKITVDFSQKIEVLLNETKEKLGDLTVQDFRFDDLKELGQLVNLYGFVLIQHNFHETATGGRQSVYLLRGIVGVLRRVINDCTPFYERFKGTVYTRPTFRRFKHASVGSFVA